MARNAHTPDLAKDVSIDTTLPDPGIDFTANGADGVMDFSQFRFTLGDKAIEVVSEREFQDNREYEDFMHENVVIEIHTSTDRNAPRMVFVGVNGEQCWLPRGQKIRLPRYMVERLARSRPHNYRTEDNPDPRGDVGMLTRRSTGMDYPFSVLQDKNPKGRQWLERIIREGR